jgi:hypothetical protein
MEEMFVETVAGNMICYLPAEIPTSVPLVVMPLVSLGHWLSLCMTFGLSV